MTLRSHRSSIFLWRVNKGETSITLLSAEICLGFFVVVVFLRGKGFRAAGGKCLISFYTRQQMKQFVRRAGRGRGRAWLLPQITPAVPPEETIGLFCRSLFSELRPNAVCQNMWQNALWVCVNSCTTTRCICFRTQLRKCDSIHHWLCCHPNDFFFASEIQSENGTGTIIFYYWYCNETSLSWWWMINACRLQQ